VRSSSQARSSCARRPCAGAAAISVSAPNPLQIRIETTEYFEVKTEPSIGEIPVDPEILEILRGLKARAKSPLVVPSR